MAYCATGSISLADWSKIKAMCSEMHKEIEEAFESLDKGKLQRIESRLEAVEAAVDAMAESQRLQDSRLDDLEETSANREFTTEEVIRMWEGER